MIHGRRLASVGAALTLALLSSLVAGPQPVYAADAPIPSGAIVDQFDTTSLSSEWSVVNNDSTKWSLTEQPGSLRLHSLQGDTWQDTNNAKNVFLRDIPSGDFELIAKLKANVAKDFQNAGIIAWQDTDNYVRAGLAHVGFATGGPTVIENDLEVNKAFNGTYTPRSGSTGEVLKIARVGSVFTTSYWSGTAWVQAAQVTSTINVQKVGFYALSASDGTSFDADFDYVAVVPPKAAPVTLSDPFAVDTGKAFLSANREGEVKAKSTRSMTQLVLRATAAADGTVALKNLGDKYLDAGDGTRVRLATKSSAASQRFAITDAGGGAVRIQSSTGYLAVVGDTVLANADSASASKWYVRPYGITNGELTIAAGDTGKAISDRLYGVFFEDINQAADGGLYAELVRNRSFEFDPVDKASYTWQTGWSKVERGGAAGTFTAGADAPLNDKNLHYARLAVTAAGSGTGAGVGISNGGFSAGIVVKKDATYNFSVWARTPASGGAPLTVRIESADGATSYGAATVTASGGAWKKYTVKLTATDATNAGRLVVVAGATVDLDMVSLFPTETFKGRANGLRKDLAQTIAKLKPKFLRFPGGCIVNTGSHDAFPERKRTYQWKDTVGPVEQRPTNANFWGYNQTYGLGYYEYFQFAEDIGATALPVVPVGVTGCGQQGGFKDDAQRQRYIQDTLDLIEFANGDPSTTWGKVRAAMGHRAPFNMKYLAIGNEEYKEAYYTNFPLFKDAVRAKYPNIKIIASAGPSPQGTEFDKGWKQARDQKADAVDEHYYSDPEWFLANTKRYDNYDRSGPKVFIGEYASHGNTFYNALAEAAYLTGVERNGDVVELASYAPLLATPDNNQWKPDEIWFDNHRVYGSPNYYVQKMYGTNMGDRVVPSTFTFPDSAIEPITGKVGLASWNTQVTYDDVKVTAADGTTLLTDDFAAGATKWTPELGTWAVTDGAYAQTSGAQPARSTAGDVKWSNYTIEVKARKTGGNEGFLIPFGVKDTGTYYWWNLGGWNNTRSAIQKSTGGAMSEIAGSAHTITTGQDYRIKIEVRGRTIRTYLNDVKVNEIVDEGVPPLFQVTTKDDKTGDVVVKVTNARSSAVRSTVKVNGITPAATAAVTSLTASSLADTNSFDDPTKVAPVQLNQTGFGPQFSYDFPANSVTFIRLSEHNAPKPDPSPSPTGSPAQPGTPSPSPTGSPAQPGTPSPSPTGSPAQPGTPSPSPTGSPAQPGTPSPGQPGPGQPGPGQPGPGQAGAGQASGSLPVTGQQVGLIVALGAALLGGGVVLYLVTRRRRPQSIPPTA